MTWEKKIAGCFGISNLVFAGHQAEEDRAFELLIEIRREHVGWNEISRAFRSYLDQHTPDKAHIEKQMREIECLYKFWLLD